MINRVVLVGRLTKDVEVRKTPNGISVAAFTVACDRRGSSNQQQTADFINCTVWRQGADFLGSYGKKGAMVGVDGRISTRSYNDKDGRRVFVTEVVCDTVNLLESKAQSQARANNSAAGGFDTFPSYDQASNDVYTYDGNDNMNDDFNTGPKLDIASDDLPF